MSAADMAALVQDTPFVDVIDDDRAEFNRALILQGYDSNRAAQLAYTLERNDGALQMLARHRLRYQQVA